MEDIVLGPISGAFLSLSLVFSSLETIPIIGLPFALLDFVLGYIGGLFYSIGLK